MDFTFLENFDLWQIPKILTNLSCYFIQFALILFAAFIVYSGIRFFISRGNPTDIGQAKKVFLYSLVGGLVVFGVYTLIFTLAGIFGFSGLSITSPGCGIQVSV